MGKPKGYKHLPTETRFFNKVDKTEGGCWEWTASLDKWGYGSFFLAGRTLRAHRVSWSLAHGEDPVLLVLHKCDNPKCVNPDHLFLGTHMDNTQDCRAKGRNLPPYRNRKTATQ